jgi:3-oxoadipate enol-lactonase
MGEHVHAGHLDIWTHRVGRGPDVLLIGGAGDTVESWQFQLDGLADRYRMTAFDNRGTGRTAMPDGPATVEEMANDAVAVLAALRIGSTHVAGFSGGSIVAQELALRRPDLVRSLVLQSTWPAVDPLPALVAAVRPLAGRRRPSERAFLEGFFLDIYTARAHNDGSVAAFIDEVLAFPNKQAAGDLQRYLDAFLDHDTTDRLPQVTAPTLVLAGGRDSTARSGLGRTVAELIPAGSWRSGRKRRTSRSRRSRTGETHGSTTFGGRSRLASSLRRSPGTRDPLPATTNFPTFQMRQHSIAVSHSPHGSAIPIRIHPVCAQQRRP